MESPMNPYAPPSAYPGSHGASEHAGQGCWRHGKNLVMSRHHSLLPPRCVKCNQPAALPIKPRTLYWHNPWIYLSLFLGVLIYFILAMILRKKATVLPGLCAVHRQHRTRGILFAWLGILATMLVLAYGFWNGSGWIIFLGFLLMIAAMIAGVIVARVVYPTMIDDHFVWVRGCGEEFLAGFPQLPPHYIPR